MEGLAAFFLESTFLGLWIFGWDRLSRRVHLFCIWMVALGASLSAAFIMAANSWMQRPVGYELGAAGEPPQLDDIGALFTNPVFIWGYFHVLLAALATGTLVLLAVSAWHLRRNGRGRRLPQEHRARDQHPGAGEHRAGAGRQPARRDRDALPADEDRGGRGPVGHLRAVLVLRVPDRGWQERREPAEGDRDPAPALAPGHAALGRRGHRAQRAAGAVRAAVRARRLHPERLRAVLVDARDGLSRDGDHAAVAVGRVAALPAPAASTRSGSSASRSGPCSRRSS